jgi:hypothetical protein
MLGVIGAAFGAGKVVAPKHRQYYEYQTTVTGKAKAARWRRSDVKRLQTYFIERRGEVKLKRDEQLDASPPDMPTCPAPTGRSSFPRRAARWQEKVDRHQPLSSLHRSGRRQAGSRPGEEGLRFQETSSFPRRL